MKIAEKLILAVTAIFALIGGVYFYQINSDVNYSNLVQVYEQEREIKPFTLIDETDQPFTNEELKDKWSLVFLGYLSCPDICPMTMAKLSGLLPKLNEVSEQPVQVLLVSVDPQRDTVEKRAQYVNYFHKDIKGLGAQHKDLYPFVTNLGLMYSIPSSDQENYYVDHSASVVLINPHGRISAIFKPEISVGKVPTIDTQLLLSDFSSLIY
ncbi:MAG: SCO family protein [Gammaproteobacteria bacterium]|nr:SCO family protein [Gammaproteobacteria bacterium]